MSASTNIKNDGIVDWRSSVLQSYRNAEVREIAKVLAALEGSAAVTPASKLMLAMRFEDQIFKSAGSLADYRKKISKRLKKLQKNYVRPVNKTTSLGGSDASSEQNNHTAKDELKTNLRNQYGESLRYIVKNATAAVTDLEKRLGSEKARQLQQHTDSCQIWVRDLEVMTEGELKEVEKRNRDENNNKTDNSTTKDGKNKNPRPQFSTTPVPLSLSQLQRIEKHLITRVGNIRSYVLKHADPNQFLLETLHNKDKEFSKNVEAGNLFAESLTEQVNSQRDKVQKHKNQAQGDPQNQQQQKLSLAKKDEDDETITTLQRALENAQAGVPPPTRNDSKELEASLRYLDKMRAASTAMMTYWQLKGDERLTTAPRDTLIKIHNVVQEGTKFVLSVAKEQEKQQSQQRTGGRNGDADQERGIFDKSSKGSAHVSLQDAWSKTIELPSSATVEVDKEDNNSNKRLRGNTYKPYYKVRKLFHPQRKTPPSLLSAIRRKGARLVVPKNTSANSVYLILNFEDAFTMTIYLSPLTVTLRATAGDTENTSATATWLPLSCGLAPPSVMIKNNDASNDGTIQEQKQLSVWGVTSTYESIGRVVEERLRDSSTHATAKLRKCFQNHVKDKTVDFEVELLEGSALLEYLQAVRATYMPYWEESD